MSRTQLPANVRAFLDREHTLLVGGRWQGAGTERIDVINPADGERIASTPR